MVLHKKVLRGREVCDGLRLHQREALSPFLFALVMERLTDEIRQESPWMMFSDNHRKDLWM